MSIIKKDPNYFNISLPFFTFNGYWCAGGAIRDCIIGEEYRDIDIFGNKNALDGFIQKELKPSGWKLTFDTKGLKNFHRGGKKLQVIYKDYKNIEDCLNSFDYTICMFGYDGKHIYFEENAVPHLLQRKLVINKLNPDHVVNSLERLQKYIQRGYTICNGGIKEIVESIRNADEKQIKDAFMFYPQTKAVRIVKYD